jgi:hypothetical protein
MCQANSNTAPFDALSYIFHISFIFVYLCRWAYVIAGRDFLYTSVFGVPSDIRLGATFFVCVLLLLLYNVGSVTVPFIPFDLVFFAFFLSRTVVFGKKGLKGQIIGQIWYK